MFHTSVNVILFSVILNFVAQVEVLSNVDYQRKPSHKIRARREINGSPSAASNQRQYVGENIIKSIGDKWKIWFHKNNATTDEPPLNETRTLLRRRRRKLAKHNLSGIVHVKNNSSVTLSQNDSLPSVHKDAEYWRKLMDCFKSVKTNSDVSTEKSIKIRYKSVQPTKAENHDKSLKHTMLTAKECDKLDLNEHTLNNDTYLTDKLKFLANLHHPVWQIGQQSHKTVNLETIQNIIDSARYGTLFDDIDNVDNTTVPYY